MTITSQADVRTRRFRTLFILGGLSAFGPLSVDMYLPSLPRIGTDFHASESQVQLTLTTCLIGMAVGQVIAGALSDALGRRRPLVVGIMLYAVASVLCAVAPSVEALAVLRLIQGFGAAAGIVIARAVVRDTHSGDAAARYFSMLMLVTGTAPILAPVFGGQLLRLASWRGVFVVLTVIGVLLLAISAFGLKETLPPERRRRGGLTDTVRTFGRLLRDRPLLGYTLASSFAFAALFSYVSSSPFLLQGLFHLSPQGFSGVFAMNSIGLVTFGQINGRLIGRVGPRRLLVCGLIGNAAGGMALFVAAVSGGGLPTILPALFIIAASFGFAMPNSTALALNRHPEAAGSASALIGVMQFAAGAAAAPIAGLGGASSPVPMATVMACMGVLAVVTFVLLVVPAERVTGRDDVELALGPMVTEVAVE